MARVRVLNISHMCGGPAPPLTPPNVALAWDLETEWEPRFKPRTIAHLQQFSSWLPFIQFPRGYNLSVLPEQNFKQRRIVPTMQWSAWQPTPSVYLITNAPQTAGNTTIFFASTTSVVNGMEVYDLTTSCIPAGTQVLSKTPTSVTLTAALTATCNSGDTIFFTYG